MRRPRNRQQVLSYLREVRTFPAEFLEFMEHWPGLSKSPFSRSFYSCREKRWDFTPEGCERVSDHWNFRSRRHRCPPGGGSVHCRTDRPVPNGTHWTHAVYESSGKIWRVRSVRAKRTP